MTASFLRVVQKVIFRALVAIRFRWSRSSRWCFQELLEHKFFKAVLIISFQQCAYLRCFPTSTKKVWIDSVPLPIFTELLVDTVFSPKSCFFAISICHQNRKNTEETLESDHVPFRNLWEHWKLGNKCWSMHSHWKYRQICVARCALVALVAPKMALVAG